MEYTLYMILRFSIKIYHDKDNFILILSLENNIKTIVTITVTEITVTVIRTFKKLVINI